MKITNYYEKILYLLVLCVVAISCSSDKIDVPELPIDDLVLPESSEKDPLFPGQILKIKGKGFKQYSEIWMSCQTQSDGLITLPAQIIEVTDGFLRCVAPQVYGKVSVFLKQDNHDFFIGGLYFEEKDESGKVIKKCIFYDNDEVAPKQYNFEFVHQDKQLLSIVQKHQGKSLTTKFFYDSKGKLDKFEEYSEETKELTVTFEYKNATQVTAKYVYEEGSSRSIDLTLDDRGNLIKKEDKANQIVAEYTYDKKKNISDYMKTYGSTESSITKYRYTYDDKKSFLTNLGAPSWFFVFNDDDLFSFSVGANNRLTSTEDGKLDDRFKYEYDKDEFPKSLYLLEENDITKVSEETKIADFFY